MNTPAIDAGRNEGLDALRGLFLVLMTLTHLPTGLSSALGQPFGQISAAEGFVMLSAFLAGQVYLRRGMRDGFGAMRKALWSRAATVYRHHLALFGFGITMVLLIGIVNEQDAITNLFTQYLANPVETAVAGLLLIYQPALFDILPMYVMFLLLTPWVLEHARRQGWVLPLAASIAIWAAATLGLRTSFHQGLMAVTGLSLPMAATGSFNPFAWQLIWVIGLWLGTARLQGSASPLRATPRALMLLALLVASFLLWRHVGGQTPFGVDASGAPVSANRLIDKWDLGPLRLLNVFALAVLIAAAGPAIARRVPLGFLSRLGRSSLPVFSAHLVCCLLALACVGEPGAAGSPLIDATLILGSLVVMQVTALVHQSSTSKGTAHATHRAHGAIPSPVTPVSMVTIRAD